MAGALASKVQIFLQDIQDINHPTEEQRRRATELLADALKYRNTKLCRSQDELIETARRLREIKAQLEDINRRLALSQKAGLGSKSVH